MRIIPGVNQGIKNFVVDTAKDAAISAALKEFESKYSDHNFSQSGQAGAVSVKNTAPLTGGPHESPDTVIKPEGGTVSNDNGFHWTNNQTMADVANEQMRDEHGSNGTSYDNKER